MNVTFPQLSGKDQVNIKSNVYVSVEPAYAPDTPANTDVAVVSLVNPIALAASKNKNFMLNFHFKTKKLIQ